MIWENLLYTLRGVFRKRSWDDVYKKGNAPWDLGLESAELIKVLKEENIQPSRAIEFGCGTGTNAIYLAGQGFDVTGVDVSEEALKIARRKLSLYYENTSKNLPVHFERVNIPDYRPSLKYDFIFDRGCFHTFSSSLRRRFSDMAAYAARPGALYLLLTGNAREPRKPGPPVLTEKEIEEAFSKHFEIIRIRDFRFQLRAKADGALGHSVLMKRKL